MNLSGSQKIGSFDQGMMEWSFIRRNGRIPDSKFSFYISVMLILSLLYLHGSLFEHIIDI